MSGAEATVEKPESVPVADDAADVGNTEKTSDDEVNSAQDKAASAKTEDTANAPATEKPGNSDSTDEPTAEPVDSEMKDALDVPAKEDDADDKAATAPADTNEAVATPNKSKARRKSGAADAKGKKLNRKSSKPKLFNANAQPGEHFLVKLKGFPPWPVIICDEDMLPARLLQTRPVTARRADGTYREDYADGGKRVNDRTFPVMYLYTNEFGWVPNGTLQELSPEAAQESINDKMRKDLQAAYELAAEGNGLDFYKDVLRQFQEQVASESAAREAAKKTKKSKVVAEIAEYDDVEMGDEEQTPVADKKSKKRKAEDAAATPQRSDSVKKLKIKLNTSATPKGGSNGISTPKSAKEPGSSKAAKSKTKKPAHSTEAKDSGAEAPKEPLVSAEERRQRKEKEVLFLRHKLQRGLLTRDQEPKEEEMKVMSDYLTKLEGFVDLEVSIIRATKINKVLKALLKLESIPREEEFTFKPRSQALLDKWNKLLVAAEAASAPADSNGVNGASAPKDGKDGSNGVKDSSKDTNSSAKAEDGPTAADQEASNEIGKEAEAVEA